MYKPKVYLDGKILSAKKAAISPFDRGLLLGDGIFETIRVYSGEPFAFDLHMQRMFDSLKYLRIKIPEDYNGLLNATRQLIRENQAEDAVLRITVTRGAIDGMILDETAAPTRLIHIKELSAPTKEQYEKGVKAVISSSPFGKPRVLFGHKTTGYLENIIVKGEAAKRGAFEGIFRNADGELVEGASTNLFLVKDDVVHTPSLSTGALPGITRELCMKLLKDEGIKVDTPPVPVVDLDGFDEIFLTNSVIEVLPVTAIGRAVVGDGKPGSVYKLLAKKYRELVKTYPR